MTLVGNGPSRLAMLPLLLLSEGSSDSQRSCPTCRPQSSPHSELGLISSIAPSDLIAVSISILGRANCRGFACGCKQLAQRSFPRSRHPTARFSMALGDAASSLSTQLPPPQPAAQGASARSRLLSASELLEMIAEQLYDTVKDWSGVASQKTDIVSVKSFRMVSQQFHHAPNLIL